MTERALTVAGVTRVPSEVVVDVDPEATVAALAAALAAELRGGDAVLGLAAGAGRLVALDPTQPVAACGLVRGAVLQFGSVEAVAAGPGRAVGAVVFEVIAGPGAGARLVLSAGSHRFEFTPSGLVTSADGMITLDIEAGEVWVTVGVPGRIEDRPVRGRSALAAGEFLLVASSILCWHPVGSGPEGVDPAYPRIPRPDADGRVPVAPPPRRETPPDAETITIPDAPERPERPRVGLAGVVAPVVLGGVLYLLTRSMLMLAFVALSPVVAVGMYFEERFRNHRHFRRAARRYLDEVHQLGRLVAHRRATEPEQRRSTPPHLVAMIEGLIEAGPNVWTRHRAEPDHLVLRCGYADAPSHLELTGPAGGDAELVAAAVVVAPREVSVPLVPTVRDLAICGVLGVIGSRRVAHLRALTLQLLGGSGPRDLTLAVFGTAPSWPSALRHVPHTCTAQGHSTVATDADQARSLARELSEIVAARVRSGRAEAATIVVVVQAPDLVERAALHEVLRNGPSVGVHTIWGATDWRSLPDSCRTVVHAEPGEGRIEAGGDVETLDALELLELIPAEVGFRALSALHDVTAPRTPNELPAVVELAAVLTSSVVVSPRQPFDLRVPLGMASGGVVSVDLRADGPHALVAGTTGSGKSELLRTLVLGLAWNHPPERCSFLLIDYKGGAAFGDLGDLPHVVGQCTDLDGDLARRVLVSLGAELRRREETLAANGAADLTELEARDPGRAPPALVVVVDELAVLVREVPEFVDGLVDLARRGRSLGMHLVLATQRPGGVVSDHIRANTNLRIALRMHDGAESDDVIGARDAAGIERTRPGRGFLRVGPNELIAFQGAGGVGGSNHEARPASVRIRAASSPASIGATPVAGPSPLRMAVDRVVAEHRALGTVPLPAPWLPPLPTTIPIADLGCDTPPERGATVLTIGRCDDPARQRQDHYAIDLAVDAGLLVVGRGGSGRTTVLQAAMHAAATATSGLRVAIVDPTGSSAWARAGSSRSVYVGNEPDRLVLLLRCLETIIAGRTRGTPGLGAVVESGVDIDVGERVLLVVDDFDQVVQLLDRTRRLDCVDTLHRVIAHGSAAGVHPIVATAAAPRPPAALSTAFARTLVLGDDPDSIERNRPSTGNHPGRGVDEAGLLVQIARPPESGSRPAARRRENQAEQRPLFRELPDHLPATAVPAGAFACAEPDNRWIRVGDIGRQVLVIGPPGSGRTSALTMLRHAVSSERKCPPERVVTVDANSDPDVLRAQLANVEANTAPVLVLVDDADRLHPEVDARLEALASARLAHVRLFVAADNRAAGRAFSGIVAALRRGRTGLLLHPDPDDGEVFGVRIPAASGEPVPTGRGYWVHGCAVSPVHVATAPGHAG